MGTIATIQPWSLSQPNSSVIAQMWTKTIYKQMSMTVKKTLFAETSIKTIKTSKSHGNHFLTMNTLFPKSWKLVNLLNSARHVLSGQKLGRTYMFIFCSAHDSLLGNPQLISVMFQAWTMQAFELTS